MQIVQLLRVLRDFGRYRSSMILSVKLGDCMITVREWPLLYQLDGCVVDNYGFDG